MNKSSKLFLKSIVVGAIASVTAYLIDDEIIHRREEYWKDELTTDNKIIDSLQRELNDARDELEIALSKIKDVEMNHALALENTGKVGVVAMYLGYFYRQAADQKPEWKDVNIMKPLIDQSISRIIDKGNSRGWSAYDLHAYFNEEMEELNRSNN